MSTHPNAEIEEESVDLEVALAQRFAERRRRYSLSLEDLAVGAQALGFPWTRGKVHAIEKLARGSSGSGTRRLSVSEFVALPGIFEAALAQRGVTEHLDLTKFLPPDNEVLVGRVRLPEGALRLILRGDSLNFEALATDAPDVSGAAEHDRSNVMALIAHQEVPEVAYLVPKWAHGPAERWLAKRWGVDPELVAIAGFQSWGQPPTDRRNALTPPEPPGLSPTDARNWRTAVRGHALKKIANDESFERLTRELADRYRHDLESDPHRPGGAFDARRRPGSGPGQLSTTRAASPKEDK